MRQAWRQAGEHMAERTLGDKVRMHARTFRLCAPFSSVQLLVLVVRAPQASTMLFMMMALRK